MPLIGSRLYICFAVLILIAPVTLEPVQGHNWQRVAECLLALLATGLLIFRRSWQPVLRTTDLRVVMLILGLGVFSVFTSDQPLWAMAEFSLLIACAGIATVFAVQRRAQGDRFDQIMMVIVVMLCLMKCTGFFASALAAFTSHVSELDTDLLLDGFSNKRFYGQFQTFTLPLVGLPLLLARFQRGTKVSIFILLACWWMIAISGGTRGTWLGMSAATLAMLFCAAPGRRWAAWQLAAVLAGFFLFWCMFSVLPGYLGIEIVNFSADRLNASLSGREIIWHQAWEMIKARPILGFGPMHFADIYNPVAAHPHQAILQWASEWGVPSALLVGWLAFRGLLATLLLIRRKSSSNEPVDVLRVCLFASLIGALTQSMVDGVIVMPYSQLWLAIVVGWLLGIHEYRVEPRAVGRAGQGLWLATLAMAVCYLGYVVVRDLPHLDERDDQFTMDYGGRFQPRFWTQGIIAHPAPRLLEPPSAANFSAQPPK